MKLMYNGEIVESLPKVGGIYRISCEFHPNPYIGSAVNIRKRFNEHFNKLLKTCHENCRLQNVYNKYGEDSFIFEILEEIENSEHLIEFEQYYIDYYGIENLINICKTAGSTLGFRHEKMIIKKMSERTLGLWKNEKYRAEHCQRVSQFSLTGEFIKTFDSISFASKNSGAKSTNIVSCCKGKHKTAGGFIWKYSNGIDAEQLQNIEYYRNSGLKKVKQFSIDGNYITTFISLIEAAASIGKPYSGNIHSCCKKKRKSAYGYCWEYA